jgi:gas vesicle protein
MGAGKRLLKFGGGSLLGAAVGTAVAVLWAPQSGDELKGRLMDRLRQARLVGAQAKAEKEDELIQKFRSEVNDPEALRDEETKVRVEAGQAVAGLGLSLNAPGAIAAQETALRANESSFGLSAASNSPPEPATPVDGSMTARPDLE